MLGLTDADATASDTTIPQTLATYAVSQQQKASPRESPLDHVSACQLGFHATLLELI